MRTLAALVTVTALAIVLPANARAVIIKTHWVETAHAWHYPATMRFYVRQIEVTKTSWRAWVGFTNSTNQPLDVKTGQAGQRMQPDPRTYFDGPGLQWTKVVGTTMFSTRPIVVAKEAGIVQPAYPSTIAPHKSWFGLFAGKLNGVPRDRILRIGFGEFSHGDPNKPETHPFSFFTYSTLHQFKLPRI